VLLDFDLGERDGIDFMNVAAAIGYCGKVLLVTAGVDEVNAANLLKRGIAGVFLKHNPPAMLVEAIREVLAGNVWLEQNYLQKLVGRAAEQSAENQVPRTRKPTEREQQVLIGVFEGLANKQIADRLKVSESSVKATLQQLFQKTGVRNRSQLVRIALEQYREPI
jgi:DNA-binding NarL/FixJ family response regulator